MTLFSRNNPDPSAANPDIHFVNGRSMAGNWPENTESVLFGMGCFWGAERLFWELPGVWVTSVGYSGGTTPDPTYEQTCTGQTGHAEVVMVAHDPARISFESLLRTFWENHDPTQGMRQGNDIGSQYRSAIFTRTQAQKTAAEASRQDYETSLLNSGYGEITTEIADAGQYYLAEDYHQQYLAKNPAGYCGIGGTGVSCPIGLQA